jgi:hypothetical protein
MTDQTGRDSDGHLPRTPAAENAGSDQVRRRTPRKSAALASMSTRRSIVRMLKQGKYAKPFDDGRFATFSLVGTNDWEDYASLVLQMIEVDTMLNIEEKLDLLLEKLGDETL